MNAAVPVPSSLQSSSPQLNSALTGGIQQSTILPTDATNTRTAVKRQPRPDYGAIFVKDPRFAFIGEWISFRQNANEPAFMPTKDASYSLAGDDHLSLNDGALLVRAGKRPVIISMSLCGKEIITRVAGSSIALISAFDGKPTVLNLTDTSSNDLTVTLPSDLPATAKVMHLKPGQIAEAYNLDTQPSSNLVATRIDVNQRLGDRCGLLVCQCHYLRALKKYNIIAALPKTDMQRVLKTAAAVNYACH